MMDSHNDHMEIEDIDNDIEVFIENSNGTQEDRHFDEIVGALQQIVLETDFVNMQQKFMRTYCKTFEDKEENKMEYMTIFAQYQSVIQKYILKGLGERVSGFSMENFTKLLQTKQNQIDEELLQMINSFGDFEIFKQLMLQYKKYYAEQQNLSGLCIKGTFVSKSQ